MTYQCGTRGLWICKNRTVIVIEKRPNNVHNETYHCAQRSIMMEKDHLMCQKWPINIRKRHNNLPNETCHCCKTCQRAEWVYCEKRLIGVPKQTYRYVERDLLMCNMRLVMVERDVSACRKRHMNVQKETYHCTKRCNREQEETHECAKRDLSLWKETYQRAERDL